MITVAEILIGATVVSAEEAAAVRAADTAEAEVPFDGVIEIAKELARSQSLLPGRGPRLCRHIQRESRHEKPLNVLQWPLTRSGMDFNGSRKLWSATLLLLQLERVLQETIWVRRKIVACTLATWHLELRPNLFVTSVRSCYFDSYDFFVCFDLSDLFRFVFVAVNETLASCGAVPTGVTSAVASIWMSADGKYGFVELFSVDCATVAMGLNGIVFNGNSLRIARPKLYNDPSAPGGQFIPPAPFSMG